MRDHEEEDNNVECKHVKGTPNTREKGQLIKDKFLPSIYNQLCVVHYGEFGR